MECEDLRIGVLGLRSLQWPGSQDVEGSVLHLADILFSSACSLKIRRLRSVSLYKMFNV